MTQRLMAHLMMKYESIGSGCEFGVVQRCCGAEPLGLLRFTGASIDNLIKLLEHGFDDFLSADDIVISLHGVEREYMVSSRRYNDFFSHTNAFAESHDESTIFSRELKKLSYLKRRFESDWRDAARIYVHCGCEDEGLILKLHAALRLKSDCVLLWVMRARSPEERGTVEIRAPGLLRGFLAHYGTFDGGPRLDLPGWAMICRSAEAIVLGLSAPLPIERITIAARYEWSSAPCGTLQTGPSGGRGRVLYAPEHRVSLGEVRVDAELPDKSLIVFSIWIRLPAGFCGREMLLVVEGAKPINHRRADLSTRETWQQIWVIAKTDRQKEALRFSFYVQANRGSQFEFAGWRMEEGGVPSEHLRPDEQWIFADTIPGKGKPKRLHRLKKSVAATLRHGARRLDPPESSSLHLTEGLSGDAVLRAADGMLRIRLFDEADGLLRAGKFFNPWHAELFSHYALCAQVRGDRLEAIKRWSEVVDFFPQVALGHYRLSENLRACGEYNKALEVVERALLNHGNDVRMVAEAARVYASVRRWADAVSSWDRALTMDGHQPDWLEARAAAASAFFQD